MVPARNIEIKARATDWLLQFGKAAALAGAPPVFLHQTDTFFRVPQGRLKLRQMEDGAAELIQYERPDDAGPKSSRYVRVPVPEPDLMRAALAAALGVRAVVRKKRALFKVGQTRIHLDEVSALGRFIELEVVLERAQSLQQGTAIARQLMAALAIKPADLVAGAYVDLLDEP